MQMADRLLPEDREVGRTEEEMTKGHERTWQVMDRLTILIVLVVSWVYS